MPAGPPDAGVLGTLAKASEYAPALNSLGLGGLGALLFWIGRQLIPVIPRWKEIAVNRANSLDDERASDMRLMRDEIAAARREAKEAVQLAQANQMLTHTYHMAVSLLSTELERIHPDNPVLKQARDMIRSTSTTDALLMAGLANLAKAPTDRAP